MIALTVFLSECERTMECYITSSGALTATQLKKLVGFFKDLTMRVTLLPQFRQHSAELSIVTRIYDQGPEEPMDHLGFHMTRAFIEKLQSFELELDVDQYVFSGDPAPSTEGSGPFMEQGGKA